MSNSSVEVPNVETTVQADIATNLVGGKEYQIVNIAGPDGNDLLPVPTSDFPTQDSIYLPVRPVPQKQFRSSFTKVIANNVDTADFTLIQTGSGQTVNQTGGNLVLTSGTTANSETIIRSNETFAGRITLKVASLLSQRIVNNNFFVELVDIIGDGLAVTVNSSTSITVTIPNNPFTAQNVGQSMYVGAIAGVAGVPGRYAIASTSGNNVTFTVAGWPGSGSGTVSLFGWNYHHLIYNGTGATTVQFDAQRNGWNSGDTAATTLTSASPGHMLIVNIARGVVALLDQLVASATGFQMTNRASRVLNTPAIDLPLYIQIRSANGTTNPASNTTWTISQLSLENYLAQQVDIVNTSPMGYNSPLGVIVANSGTNPISGTVTTSTAGSGAHAAAISGNPIRLGGRALTADYAAVATGQTADLKTTLVGALIQKPFAIPELDWSYAAASGGITNTTGVTVKASAGAGIRNYVTSLSISNNSATATETLIRDGAGGTVLWRGFCPANMPMANVVFANPLRGTAATLLEVINVTTGAAVYINLTGYAAP